MAGDWIKMRNGLHEHPKVLAIADALGLNEFDVVGRLHRLWAWVGEHSENGNAVCVTDVTLDRVMCHAGVTQQLRNVGWVVGESGCLTFPNFEEHNGKTAKKRAQASARQDSYRKNMSRTKRDSSVTREEKRREEKKEEPPTPLRDSTKRDQYTPEFEAWWAGYPVRDGAARGDKRLAFERWQALGPTEHPRIVMATARLIASDQFPKDAQRFLKPERGGKTPVYETWLDDTKGAPVAGRKKTHTEIKEARNVEYDDSWLKQT